jgi:hypothetical protein
MSDFEIVIHLRNSAEPIRVPLPDVPAHVAEADRQGLIYDLDQARLAEVPVLSVQTASGFPPEPIALDPAEVTEVDLIDLPIGDA